MEQPRIAISGGYGNGNSGDEALLICMLEELRQRFPNAYFTVFSDDTEVSKRYCPDTRFVYSGRFGLFEPGKSGIAALAWIWEMFTTLFWSNLLITGGGTILQDATHPLFVPFWFFKVVIAQLLFTPTMFYGIGVGPLRRVSSSVLMNIVGRSMDRITLRGPLSKRWSRKFKIPSKRLEITADPAVMLPAASKKRVDEILSGENVRLQNDRPVIGFCIREWYKLHTNSITDKNWTSDGRRQYKNLISSLVDLACHIISFERADILFVPMSLKVPNDDNRAAKLVIDRLPERYRNHCHLIGKEYLPQEMKGLLGLCQRVVSMRFHPLIYATTQKIPVLGIAYGLKTYDYLEALELEKYAIAVDDISSNALIGMYESTVSAENTIVQAIEKRLPKLYKGAQRNVQVVAEILARKA